MRVAIVACSAPVRTAVGNLLAEKVAFFADRGAEVRVFLESAASVHPQLLAYVALCTEIPSDPAWNYLAQSDIVFFEFSQGFDLLGLLPQLIDEKPRLIATYYGISPSTGWPGPQRDLLERGCRDRGLLWCADAVIVHSRFTVEELTLATSLPRARIQQLKIPLDLTRWRPESSGESGLPIPGARADSRSSRSILLFVGRLALNKRLPLVIEALAHLPDAEAWIVGNDRDIYADQARHARELARRLDVADRVRWLGDVADESLPALYRQADVLVLPSIHEGLGIPVLEAQAAGLPVVAARAAALPETIADAGLTFRPDDVADFVRQLRRVRSAARHSLSPGTPGERAGVRGVVAPRSGAASSEGSSPSPPTPLPRSTGGEGSPAAQRSPDEAICGFSSAQSRPTRFPAKTKCVALVAFRFGAGFVGGAEASLRNLGHALQRQGYAVEVFTTCTVRESDWKNDLPPGDTTEDGFLVHRFPIDPHDRPRHDDAFRAILENNGSVAPAVEAEYLANSIQSSALMADLKRQIDTFDAIITCPYLHGLTFRVAQAFPEKTLLLPCFHDEPAARLRSWLDVYGSVAGLLYHTPEEQDFAQSTLGLNHPGATLIGTCLPSPPVLRGRGAGGEGAEPSENAGPLRGATNPLTPALSPGVPGEREFLVYCGRYSIQKNVPLLLDFARRYQTAHPDRFGWIFVGEGNVRLPAEPWLRDAGRVTDEEKHRILARADALVQLSTQESLSLVILEAWQHATPVVVHAGAPVLVGQVGRSGGGVAVGDYDAFARALDDLWATPNDWRERGRRGQQYTQENYLDPDAFGRRLVQAIENMSLPLAEQMRRRGLLRVRNWDRAAWREEFGQFVEGLLDAPPRAPKRDLVLEPLLTNVRASIRQTSLLLPVRIHNRGNVPATTGHAATRIDVALRDADGGAVRPVNSIALVDLILPGRTATVMLTVDLPQKAGQFTLSLQVAGASAAVTTCVEIGDGPGHGTLAGGVAPLLEAAQLALAQAHARQSLPRDYLDVCEGRFARAKRWLKQKLFNNFKRAYVDVLSAQQSDVNRRLVESVQQLTECCRALDQTVRALQERVTQLGRVHLPSPPVLRGRGVGGEGAEPRENTAPLQGAADPLTPALSPGVPGEREKRESRQLQMAVRSQVEPRDESDAADGSLAETSI